MLQLLRMEGMLMMLWLLRRLRWLRLLRLLCLLCLLRLLAGHGKKRWGTWSCRARRAALAVDRRTAPGTLLSPASCS